MKRQHSIISLTLVLFAFILSGCPVGIDYPPGYPGKEKLDKGLIGTWYNSNPDNEVVEIEISKADDYMYSATVITAGSMYSLESIVLSGWCTEIGGLKFVYFRSVSESEPQFFSYAYNLDGNELETFNFSLLDGGVDAVTSTEAYRSQIETSIKMTGGLSDTIRWMKK